MKKSGADSRGYMQVHSEADHETHLALHREYRAGGPRHRDAYDRLVMSLSGIAWSWANHYAGKWRGDAGDLFQDGVKDGLLPAITRFNESKGVKISTYAYLIVDRVVRRRARKYALQRKEMVLRRGAEAVEKEAVLMFPLSAVPADAEQLET